jgi:hypothetical protein
LVHLHDARRALDLVFADISHENGTNTGWNRKFVTTQLMHGRAAYEDVGDRLS